MYIGKNNFLKFFSLILFDNSKIIFRRFQKSKTIDQKILSHYENNKFLTAFEYKKNDIFKFWVAENSLLRGKYYYTTWGCFWDRPD